MIVIRVLIAVVLSVPLVWAQDVDTVTIVIKDHRFNPNRVIVPAGKKIKLVIDNQDLSAEEFESYPLNREKVIAGGKKGFVFIGPLKKGRYEFMGEFHQETAKGEIVVE